MSRYSFTSDPAHPLPTLQLWRQRMIDHLLMLGLWGVLPLAVLDVIVSLQEGRTTWAMFIVMLTLAFIPFSLLQGRYYVIRSRIFLLFTMVLTLITLWNMGLIGTGRTYALISVFCAVLLLSSRGSRLFITVLLSAVSLVLVGQVLEVYQIAPESVVRAVEPGTILLNLLVLLLTMIGMGYVMRSLIENMSMSLQQTTQALAERDQMNQHLEALVAARTTDLAQQLRYAEALEHCSKVLLSGSGELSGFSVRMATALETVRAAMDADRIAIVHLPPSDGAVQFDVLVSISAPNLPELRPLTDAERADLPATLNPAHFTAGFNGAVQMAFSAHPAYQRYLDEQGVQAMLVQPLTIGGAVWGYLQVFDHQAPRTWDAASIRVLYTAAEIILSAHGARQASQALYERESVLRTINDTLPEGFLFQLIQRADGSYERFTYVSRGVEALMGFTAAQVLSDPATLHERIVPEDRAWVVEADIRSLQTFSMFDVEARYVKGNGQVGWFQVRSMPQMHLPEGRVLWNGVSLEITSRKEAELALAASQSRLRALGDNLPGGFIYQYRHDGRRNAVFTYLSSGVERVWGVTAAAGLADVNAIYRTIIPEDLLRIYDAEIHSRDTLTTFSEELRHRMPDGQIRWALMSAQPRRERDGSILWDGVAFDITERKQAAEALQRAKEAAEAADQAKSGFLAHMSHEIRTPLNAVIGMAELLVMSRLDEQQQGYVNTISTASHSLLAVINQILDFSRIESGQLRLDVQPFELRLCLLNAIDLVSHNAQRKGLRLSYTLADDLPAVILGDGMRLEQVILNILANAVKFTEYGWVHLSAEVTPIASAQMMLTVAVQDSGIGMSSDAQRQVFNPFIQADGSTARRYGGTGLGLAICRQLVLLMGGTIRLESSVGAGSTFTINVPITVVNDLPLQVVDPVGPEPLGDFVALRVLIAEDNPVNQQVARELLLRLGHNATVVPDGVQALEAVLSQPYDVVLMDVQMPHMDGEEATRRIRAAGDAIRQPFIVALTASALNGDRERLLALGMDEYLSKPVHLYDLQRVLARIVPTLPAPSDNSQLPPPANPNELIDHSLLDQFFLAIGEPEDSRIAFTVALVTHEIPPQIEIVGSSLQDDDRKGLKIAAHRLRGGCLQLGLRRLAGVCSEIEQRTETGDHTELTELYMQLRQTYQATLQALRGMV